MKTLSVIVLSTVICLSTRLNASPTTKAPLTENELVRQINYHDDLYWNKGRTEITDAEYDELTRALKKLNPTHSLLTRVNGIASDSERIVHAKPMLSLEKAYSLDEIVIWAKRAVRSGDERLLIQPKYDGLAADYTDGILSTRGNGKAGRNISHVLSCTQLCSKNYTGKINRAIRGELILLPKDFKRICVNMKKLNLKPYATPRNAVAGITAAQKFNSALMKDATLTLIDFKLHEFEIAFQDLNSKWAKIEQQIASLPYPMDGIVIKYADADYGESLGSTTHHPRSAIAFKFPNKTAEVVLTSVEWQCGKTRLTPVAKFDRVKCDGVMLSKATLHNLQNILTKDIHIGDLLTIERAGGVIPYVKSSRPGTARQSVVIDNCPSCKQPVSKQGVNLCCINKDCPGTVAARLKDEVKKAKIKGLGPATVAKMVDSLKVRTLDDIRALTLDDIMSLKGFGRKSSEKLFEAIKK